MPNRITKRDLDYAVERLNTARGTPLEYSTNGAVNINHYCLDYACGGVKLVQIVSAGGGIRTISTGGYGTKRELYNFIQGMSA